MSDREHGLSSPVQLDRTLSDSSIEKRTRRRFTPQQICLLEELYRETPHPTRERRDALAKENKLDTRAVTVWFQNKRQTERRSAINASRKRGPKRDPLASPFSDVRGKTIHTTRSSSPASDLSHLSDAHSYTHPGSLTPTISRKRRRSSSLNTHGHAITRTLSLDRIAARTERPHAPETERDPHSVTPPRRTQHASLPFLHARSPPRALWETMPSSPVQPRSPEVAHSPLLDFDFGHGRLKRRRTLEWACARERAGGVGGHHMDMDVIGEGEDPLVLDLGGDTDVETEPDVHEAVTPKSYPRSGGGASIAGTELWEEERLLDGDKENRSYRWVKVRKDIETKMVGAKEPRAEEGRKMRDEDMMDAALALCGLGGRM